LKIELAAIGIILLALVWLVGLKFNPTHTPTETLMDGLYLYTLIWIGS